MVGTNVLRPEHEGVSAIVAAPAVLFVRAQLHSPLAAAWNVNLVPQFATDRHVICICLHCDLAHCAVDGLMLDCVERKSLLHQR